MPMYTFDPADDEARWEADLIEDDREQQIALNVSDVYITLEIAPGNVLSKAKKKYFCFRSPDAPDAWKKRMMCRAPPIFLPHVTGNNIIFFLAQAYRFLIRTFVHNRLTSSLVISKLRGHLFCLITVLF